MKPCRSGSRAWLGAFLLCAGLLWYPGARSAPAPPAEAIGRKPFLDRRNPPTWRDLSPEEQAQFELGQLVFNTSWVPAGQPGSARRDGLGPHFIAASCDSCHNNGARGRPAARPETLPNSFAMQLGGPGVATYGHVLATQSLEGVPREARIRVERLPREGRYADGERWSLLEPHYRVDELAHGPLPADAILRPRIGPALFGVGLLASVPREALADIRARQQPSLRGELADRFNWQSDAASIELQTARAFAREMGITSALQPEDDCTALQTACRAAPDGGAPEASGEFFAAVVAFQRYLAVPERAPGVTPSSDSRGRALFASLGCADCHVPELPVALPSGPAGIDAYTDLLTHDLGPELADRTVAGQPAESRWRTAPLWGLAHALSGGEAALLHDGRAASLEQAILWHGGQAEAARDAFTRLPRESREHLLAWLATL